MIGAIIGDIVGSRFEIDNHLSTDFDLYTGESVFTDDTVCTVAVAKWLLEADERGTTTESHIRDILQKFCIRYPGRGYGGNFRNWIVNPVPYNSYGNGAAMRISPVGDYLHSEADVLAYSGMASAISHNHPEGIKGAQAVALAGFMARNGASKKVIREVISSRFNYDLNFTCDEIRGSYQFNETCQKTVPQAIVAFLDSTGFESAIRLAVSIGGDSDTLACITGGIAEAFYKEIPVSMIENAKKRLTKELWKVAVRFYNQCRFVSPEIRKYII